MTTYAVLRRLLRKGRKLRWTGSNSSISRFEKIKHSTQRETLRTGFNRFKKIKRRKLNDRFFDGRGKKGKKLGCVKLNIYIVTKKQLIGRQHISRN